MAAGPGRSGRTRRRRRLRAGTLLAAVVLSAGAPARAAGEAGRAGAPAPAPRERDRAGREGGDTAALARRVAELEALVAVLQVEVARLRAEAAQSGRSAAPPADASAATAAAITDLQKKIEALTLELERLRIGEAAVPAGGQDVQGLGPAAAKVYAARRGASIGGYGEVLYQGFSRRRDDGTPATAIDTADLERAVLYFGYKFDDRTLFNSEVEFEHAVAGEGEPGETSVEFAYLDYRATRAFGLRGGLLLVPVGYLNELHEPPIFLGARRPEVEQFIIPSTWRELGFGIYGDAGPLSYRAYLVTGLDASGFSADQGIREGRQEGAEAKAADFAATARIDYTPTPGLVAGLATFTGRTGQRDAAIGEPRFTLWEAHAGWNGRGVHVRGLYARGTLSGVGRLNAALGLSGSDGVGERMEGWYGEIAYNLLAPLKGSTQELSPFVRYESLDTQARVAPGYSANSGNDRRVRTLGLHYRPIPNIAIKVDVQNFANRAGTALDQVNVALGYLF